MPTNLTELALLIHSEAKAKGWHDRPRSPLEEHALITSEIGEATDAVRDGLPEYFVRENGKPDGEAVEIIDAIIRALDYCGKRGWDVDEIMSAKRAYNRTRAHRHGNKLY